MQLSAMQPQFQAEEEWSNQMEQLRNDLFGIVMSVSALSDRLDRLEQRMPAVGTSVQAGLVTLRGEIETWLQNNLNAAVERCVQNTMSQASHHAYQPPS